MVPCMQLFPWAVFLLVFTSNGVKSQDPCKGPIILPSLTEYKYQTLPRDGIRVDIGFSYKHRLEASWFLRKVDTGWKVTDYFIPPAGDGHYSYSASYAGDNKSARFTLIGTNINLDKPKRKIRFRLFVRHPCNVIHLQTRVLTWEWMQGHNFTMPVLMEVPKPIYEVQNGQNLKIRSQMERVKDNPELVGMFLFGFSKYADFDSKSEMIPVQPTHDFRNLKRPNIKYTRHWVSSLPDKYIFNNNVTFAPLEDQDVGLYYTTVALNLHTAQEYWLARLKIITFSNIQMVGTQFSMRVYSQKAGEFDPLPSVDGDGQTIVPLPRPTFRRAGFPPRVQCMADTMNARMSPEITVFRYETPGNPQRMPTAAVFTSPAFRERSYVLPNGVDNATYICCAVVTAGAAPLTGSADEEGGEASIESPKRYEIPFTIRWYKPVQLTRTTRTSYYNIKRMRNSQYLQLNCAANGDPTPEIRWFLNPAYGEPGEVIKPGRRDYLTKNMANRLNDTDAYIITQARRTRFGEWRSWLRIGNLSHLTNLVTSKDVTYEITCYAYNDFSFDEKSFSFYT